MNWINGVDMLQDEEGTVLLKGFANPDKRNGTLLERIEMNLDTFDPSKDFVKQVSKGMIKKMKGNTEAVEEKWKGDTVTSKTQDEMNERIDLMIDKAALMMLIYEKMLEHKNWKSCRKDVYKNANHILSEILPLIQRANKENEADDVFSTISYYTIRRYLAACACRVISAISVKKGGIPLDLVLPTIRRLGMVDVLDEKLSKCDDWFGILKDLEKTGDGEGPIPRTHADDIIQERCLTWSKARSSLNYYCKKPPEEPPNGFEYIRKCCNYDCSNCETPENRHSVRCQKCWYFHCCSPGCESYAERVGLHKCDLISSKKAVIIKKQTQMELRAYCNFCSALQSDLSSEVIHGDGLKSVQYCCEDCKEWDANEGNHKEKCKQ